MAPVLVLFDLDGTLVDTAPDIASALAAALEPTGVPPPPLEVVKRMVGDGARELVRRALAAEPGLAGREESEEKTLGRFLASYRANVCVASRLYPGVAEGLTALRGDATALAVVTNKPGDLARSLLGTLGVVAFFEAIIGEGDGFPRKPDPTAARSVLAKVGAPVTRGEVIGFVGHTGLATGPHLHFEVSLGGVKLDPMTTPFGGAAAADPHAGAYARLRPAIGADLPPA